MRKKFIVLAVLILCVTVSGFAEDEYTLENALDMVWLFLGASLVFIMQAGFAMVETGLTRAKNATNIVMKNLMDFCFGAIVYWAIGWGFMYGTVGLDAAGDAIPGKFIGLSDFFKNIMDDPVYYRDWFFQVVFAATAATIVSGAMAERTRFKSYLIYTCFISAVIYPIQGHWIWGGGWLSELGFHDFAGSTVVHSVGGWAALMGALVLGGRLGKYAKGSNGVVSVRAIPGHNIPLAMLGVFLLWFGWYGFNGASTLSGSSPDIARVCVTTTLAASAGAISSLVFSWIWFKKPDASMTMNGALAGLVAITAPCGVVSPGAAIIIGLVGGVLVVLSVEFIDKVLKIDDPVGACSVHLTCGIWGTLAVGIFGDLSILDNGLTRSGQIGAQALGVVSVGAWAAVTSLILFLLIKATVGLRVDPKEELVGLDITEHKSEAYAGFQIFSNT
ncbi:MAG: ammonium transporter [Spirochaetales bacterium]|nr:ammonium transporter [Spirochaetales bacterium]